MKLRLKLLGSDPIPARVIANLLEVMDDRIFQLEGKSILALHDRFPQLRREDIESSFQIYERDYRGGVFSMLEIESIEYGSIIIAALVSGAAYAIVAATVGKDIEEEYAQTSMSKRIRHLLRTDVKLFFINQHSENLMHAVQDTAKHLYHLALDRKPDDGKGTVTRIKNIHVKEEKDCKVLEVEVEVIKTFDLKTYYKLVEEYNALPPDRSDMDNVDE